MAQQNADQAVHIAAREGLTDKLAEMLAMDVALIDAKGMDARTPGASAATSRMILKAFAVLRRRKYRELEEAWTKVAAGSMNTVMLIRK